MVADESSKPKLVGINHVALEVGDIDAALGFYGYFFSFTLRSRSEDMAFIDLGDQFLALSRKENRQPDRERHFGLVVNDRSGLRERLEEHDVELVEGNGLNFRDPWGNFVQVVEYADIQFSKTAGVLNGMGLELHKTSAARQQLREKDMLDP